MDHVTPREMVADAVELARKKAGLSTSDLLIRGTLAGALLAIATSLAFVAVAQGLPPLVGAAIFPVGFVILVLLGQELATGNFALLPMGVMAGKVRISELLRNWAWVYVGNLMGSVLYAALFYLALTNCGRSDGGTLAELFRQAAQKKTLGFMALGASGWATALVRALLCNWMVTLGVVLSLASRSTIGKIVVMWLPITTFFALGYEHSIVNMYVIPTGMLLGAPVSVAKWWLWNQIPVTLGNVISGALFTGLPLFATYSRKPAMPAVAMSIDLPESDLPENGRPEEVAAAS
jgi:formate/nitrite transporter